MVNSSLAYEILVYLNSFYFGMFAACEIGMAVLKAVNLPYEPKVLTVDAGLLATLLLVETVRLILARRGNLAEHSIPVCISIVLTIPSAMGITYLLYFQSHIIRLEYILCGLMLALQATELFFAFHFIVTICKPPSYD